MMSEPKPKQSRRRTPRPQGDALEMLWKERGEDAIQQVRDHDASAYVMAIARLVADLDD